MTERVHLLKILPIFFDEVADGRKTFEIRKNDRDFRVDDDVILREYYKGFSTYSGREISAVITYLTRFKQSADYVVFSLGDVKLRS